MRIRCRLFVVLLGLLAGVFAPVAALSQGAEVAVEKAAAGSAAPALLLANAWNESIDPTGWWVNEKYDGLRGYWDGRNLWSRKGQAIAAPDDFLAELPRDVPLDGELWMGRGQFEETLSTVLSQTLDERWKRVKFMVFDAPRVPDSFEQRMELLRKTLPAGKWRLRREGAREAGDDLQSMGAAVRAAQMRRRRDGAGAVRTMRASTSRAARW